MKDYRIKNFDYQVVTIWEDDATPNNSADKVNMDFEFPNGNFQDPVYVDMRTGQVFDIPDANWKKSGTKYTFTKIPVYDSPILIAERSIVLPEKEESNSGH